MASVLRALVRNPVLLNMLFLAVVIAGIATWTWLPKEQFPQISVDQVAVSVVWPGASPQDLEDLVARPIEDAVAPVEGIKHTFAELNEGRALVTLEFVRGTDVDEALDEIQRAVTQVDDLPEDALEPVTQLIKVSVPITKVALVGDTARLDLAETLADELRTVPGVSDVEIRGAATQLVRIELDRGALAARGLGPSDVAAALDAAGQGLPAGTVEVGGQRVLVRSENPLRTVEDLADVPLDAAGAVRVGDLGRVYVDFEPPEVRRLVDGFPAITLTLFRSDDADTLAVVDRVDAWAAERRLALPDGLSLRTYDDSALLVRDRLDVVLSNAVVGLLLVAGCLWWFVGGRNALLVVWGMPVAYLGAVLAMNVAGVTVNVISTFALLVVTGIIVDDAIVIVENVQRYLEQGKDRVTAAIEGTVEVIPAVAVSTTTTCLAFAPLLLLEGTVGRVMSIIPLVVIFSLVASLLEAFVILPGHLAHYAQEGVDTAGGVTGTVKRLYEPVLNWVTGPRARYLATAVLIVGFLGTMSLTLFMRTSLQTPGKPYFATINVDLPVSTSVDETVAVLNELAAFAREEGPPLTWMAGLAGRQSDPSGFPVEGSNHGQLKLGFVPEAAVFAEVPAFLDTLRARLATTPEIQTFAIQTLQGGPPAGRDIDVKVRSRTPSEVVPVAAALEDHLRQRAGVRDVRNEASRGTEEFRVEVDTASAARLGLREGQIALAARAALDGQVALELPLGERTTEVRVSIAGLQTRGTDLEAVRDTPVATPSGALVRLRQVADVVRTRGIAQISRVDGQRAVRVSALVDQDVTTAEEEQVALEAAFDAARREHPGVDLFVGGALADSAESFGRLPVIFLLAVFLIYGVLAVQFRSYVQPLIVVAAIPLGVGGAVAGLFLFGMDLSLIAMIGAVGLTGIVVNDSLVLIDFVNARRERGMTSLEAVRDAALTRLRPILITTITTVLGLGPLALGLAGSDPLLAPMAVAIAVGLTFATGLTLVLIPVLYLIQDDVTQLFARRGGA